MDSLIHFSKKGLIRKLQGLKDEAVNSKELLPFRSEWFHEFKKLEPEVLNNVFKESELEWFYSQLLRIDQFFRSEERGRDKKSLKVEALNRGALIYYYGSADNRKIHAKMVTSIFDYLVEILRNKSNIGYSFADDDQPIQSNEIEINGIYIRNNGGEVEYGGVRRTFKDASVTWRIIFECIKPAIEHKPRQEWGTADVDETLRILNEVASAKGKSRHLRDDIHRSINVINDRWIKKIKKRILRIDNNMNCIVLAPVDSPLR